jgi:hypothetical protein
LGLVPNSKFEPATAACFKQQHCNTQCAGPGQNKAHLRQKLQKQINSSCWQHHLLLNGQRQEHDNGWQLSHILVFV